MKIILVGNIASGKSTIAAKLAKATGYNLQQIDTYRNKFGDGSMAADFEAKKAFSDACAEPINQVIELLGTGGTAVMLYSRIHNAQAVVFGIYATPATCLARYHARKKHTFLIPNFGTNCESIIKNYNYNHPKALFAPKPFFLVDNANGTPHTEVVNQIMKLLP